MRVHVQERVHPLLEATSQRAQEILDSIRGKAAEAEKQASEAAQNGNGNGAANGNGHA